jgi:IS5 family transposase
MDAVVPWARLVALIAPHYPKPDGPGRPPLGLEKMLRIYFLQQWFNLSDPQAEDAIYDSESMRRFARVELGQDVVPDETTILRFRHLLEAHGLTAAIFEAVKALLVEKLLLKSGTIVDATIIAAPSSTKNATQMRDPEMRQVRKGRAWHFGMKLHIGTDRKGRVHSVTATHAARHDITQLPALLHGEERALYGDQAYWKEADRAAFEARGVRYRVNRRPATQYQPLTRRWRAINRARSRTRACGEHAFHIVKRLWGFTKVRYRGLAKNLARAWTMFALANLYMVRRHLMPEQARCVL